MSTIGKKPLVDVLLESLDNEKLKLLKANLDTNYIVDYDDFVDLYKNGILGQVYVPTFNGIYVAPYLLNFEPDEQHLVPYLLNSNGKLDKIDEKITILELRSALADRMIEAGAVIPENVKFTVTNIKSLTDAQCKDLKAGDIIAKKTGNQYHCYIVSYNEKNQGLCLTYADASVVETVSYDYIDGHWVYNSEDKTDFSQIGGGLPEVTALDNEKVLEVIAGVWGKGRRKVNVIDAPSSTTLIEEQIEIFKGGVFINGQFLGLKNPVFYPCSKHPSANIYGSIYLSAISYDYAEIGAYAINNNVISKKPNGIISFNPSNGRISINGKTLPAYPEDTGNFTLKCVDGVLTWVQDV